MKKLLSILLTALIFISVAVIPVNAERAYSGDYSRGESDHVTWNYDPATKTITISGTGKMELQSIHTCDTRIPWYSYTDQIEHIIIEEGITVVGEYAFNGARSLKTLSLPSTLESFGDHSFGGCPLKEIVFPESVGYIGRYAFCGSYNLERIEFKKKTKDIMGRGVFIDSLAFTNCEKLKEIKFEDKINVSIEPDALSNCDSLREITIPDNAANYLYNAFFCCRNLEAVHFSGNPGWINDAFRFTPLGADDKWVDGVLYVDNFIHKTDPEIIKGDYVVKDGTKGILYRAFAFNEELKSIVIPDGAKYISPEAFFLCELETVYLPHSIEYIGYEAFKNVYNEPKITIYYDGTTEDWNNIEVENSWFYTLTDYANIICMRDKTEDNDNFLSKILKLFNSIIEFFRSLFGR